MAEHDSSVEDLLKGAREHLDGLNQAPDTPVAVGDPAETPDAEGRFILPVDAAQDLGLLQAPLAPPLVQDFKPTGSDVDSLLAGAAASIAGQGVGIADPFIVEGVYSPIPLSEALLNQKVELLLQDLHNLDGGGYTFIRKDILSKLEAMEMLPEVQHILSNQDVIDDWENMVWPNVLDAMVNGNVENSTHLGVFRDMDIEADEHVKDWVSKFSTLFSSEELDFLYQLFAATPTMDTMFEQSVKAGTLQNHFTPTDSVWSRGWKKFQLGVRTFFYAPEVVSTWGGSPRSNILTMSALYLQDNDLNSKEDRDEFFRWIIRKTGDEAERLDRMSGGFDRLASRTVTAPIMFTKGLIKKAALSFASPEDYMWREGLTAGQVLAHGVGLSPNSKYAWDAFSGGADALTDMGLDPFTWLGGLGGGMTNVTKIMRPANMNRLQAIGQIFALGKSSKMGFGIANRGTIPRIYWGFLSKQADEFTDTRKAWKAWNWIAESGNAPADITARYPSMSNTPKNELMRLVGEKTPEGVRDIVLRWMSDAPLAGAPTPSSTEKEIQALLGTRPKYFAAVREALDSGEANLRGLDASYDGVHANQVFEPVLSSVAFREELGEKLASKAARILDEGNEIIGADVTLKDGRIMKLYRGAEGTIAGYVDGEWVGTIQNAKAGRAGAPPPDPDVFTVSEFREQGVFSGLYDALSHAGKNAVDVSPTRTASIDAAQGVERIGTYRAAEFTGSGGRRTVVSTIDRGPINVLDVTTPQEMARLLEWLNGPGLGDEAAELAAHLSSGIPLNDLTESQKAILRSYMLATDADGLTLEGVTILGKNLDSSTLHGLDAEDVLPVANVRAQEAAEMIDADRKIAALREGIDPNVFFVMDIPRRRLSTALQDSVSGLGGLGSKKWLAGVRRTGFQIVHALPGNISFSKGAQGAKELRNWIKALGGGDQLGRKWANLFLEADITQRYNVANDAFKELGDAIDNPQLREGLVQFFQKQGQRTFSVNRSGVEIGLTAQGSILPVTITHLTNELVMPQADDMIKMVRRFKGRPTSARFRAGLLKGTQDRRQAIVSRLKASMLQRGIPVDNLTPDEWLSVGYADVLTQITGRSRADSLGAINAIGAMAYSPFKKLHNAFTIGQLAFRPIPWGGRILLEETIRADLVGLPSLWSSPVQFIGGFMDARAIRKMSKDAAGQARVLDGLVEAKLFPGGVPNEEAIVKVFPDIAERLAKADIDPGTVGRYQSFVAHELGKSLIGGEATTNARIGSRFNWARRTMLRQRRQQRAHRVLDDTGLLESFRFEVNALEIANRSLFSEFISEASSGYMQMPYQPGAMTPEGIAAYGRGWGRSVFQMFGEDPLIRRYGLPRMVAHATGVNPSVGAAQLLADPDWQKIRPVIQRLLIENDLKGLSALQEADWYIVNVVDEMTVTLLGDLSDGDLRIKAELAQALIDRTPYRLEFGTGKVHTIQLDSDNYEGIAETFVEIAQERNALGLQAPLSVNAQIDPRFGQRGERTSFRKVTDWIMQKAGEDATQRLNRQQSYLAVHRTHYQWARNAGADVDSARAMAHEKAVEIVNYIFFNNKDIPNMLKKMNKVIPFFGAMYEVSQTWLYKIPANSGWPVGAAHLVRKVDRTIDALHNIGILETDDEGQMFIRADAEGAGFGRALNAAVRAPLFLAENMIGLGRMALEPFNAEGVEVEPWRPADLGAWTKDGFKLAIGNPLDFRSHGIMAVNQWSVGPTPAISYPLGLLIERFESVDRQMVDTEDMTLGEYAERYPEQEIAEVLYLNRDALEETNGKEAVARAFDDGDPSALKMPDMVTIPRSSLWDTLIDDVIFPFGTYETAGQVITSPSPAALNHIWRGFFTAFGQEDSEIMGFLLGNMSNYQMTGEVIFAMQHLEATEGLATELRTLAVERGALLKQYELEILVSPDGVQTLLDPEAEGADDLIELLETIKRKEEDYLQRAHSNAAGSSIMRGLMGSFLPATPKMFDWQQEEAAAYWDQRNIAKEVGVRGSANFADIMATLPRPTGQDLKQALSVVNAFMEDPSGMQAKLWVQENNPSLAPFLKGKSFWDGGVPPPEALEFDQWMDDMREGRRQKFDPEVWLARYQRASVVIDKEVAIITEYGNNPDLAAQRILMDYDKYRDIIEDFDMEFAAQEFLDEHVYEGKYAAWRRQVKDDNISLLSELTDRLRFMQDSVDATVDLLEYMDLDPDEERRIRGILGSGIREVKEAIEELQRRDTADRPWLGLRDRVLVDYWENISTPYHEGRQVIFDEEILSAKNSRERSIGFNNLRLYDNAHIDEKHTVTGFEGADVQMPNELLRAWNTKPQKEKEERILSILDKKPEWLNQFQVEVLLAAAPQLDAMLPTTPADWAIYDQSAKIIRDMQEQHEANPAEMTESELERNVSVVKEALQEFLLANGRAGEVMWSKFFVPAQRLDFAGLLPQTLQGIMPQLNTTLDMLRAAEKSPTSNVGEAVFLVFKAWLRDTYFRDHPGSEEDLAELGRAMFDEGLQSAVLAQFLQGDRFGKLE